MSELGFAIGALAAKLLSVAGIGSLIAGAFVSKKRIALAVGVAFGVLDTIVLNAVKPTGASAFSLVAAVLVGILCALGGHAIGNSMRKSRQHKSQ